MVGTADAAVHHYWTHTRPANRNHGQRGEHRTAYRASEVCGLAQSGSVELPVGELPGLQVDLLDELPGWGHDDGRRLLELQEGAGCHAVRHQLLQDGEQEGSLDRAEDTRLLPTHRASCGSG